MQKKKCYGNYRDVGLDSRLLKELAKANIDNIHVRVSRKQKYYIDESQGWDDCWISYVDKSWKYQSRLRRQWMKS